ncbi:MAG: histidine kinase [Bacteroidetes bacterium]|nr:histidine kinase [Bacteroidota bacterium]
MHRGMPPLPPPHFEKMHGKFHPFKRHGPPTMPLMNQILFLYLIGIFVSLYIRVKRDLEQMLIEKNQAELAYLKSQINPHFLFNTFNSIYALAIREHADKTADGMLKLSGMMRYIVTETNTDFVPLEKEINYVNDFIELQRLRLDKGIVLHYVLEGKIEDQQISPLILIPFIENAFKHGVNPDEASEISIHVNIQSNNLSLHVKNNKVHHSQVINDQMGFGIANTRSRLERIYAGKFQLDIHDSATQYEVDLKLKLI